MPFDPTDKAKLLYDAVSKDYDLGTYDEFQAKLKDPTKRKAFFDGIGHEYDLGDYNTFNQKLGYDSQEVKEQSQPQPQQPVQPRISQMPPIQKAFSESTNINQPQQTLTANTARQNANENEQGINNAVDAMAKRNANAQYGEDYLKQNIKKQIQDGKLVPQKQSDGTFAFKQGADIGQSFVDALTKSHQQTLENNFLANADKNTKLEYLNRIRQHPETRIVQESNRIPTGVGGQLGNMIGENTELMEKGTIGALAGGLSGATGGASMGTFGAMAQDFTNSGYAQGLMQNYNTLKEQNPKMSDEEALDKAEKVAPINAAVNLATGAILSKASPEATEGLVNAFKQTIKSSPKVLGATALGSVAGDVAGMAAGEHKSADEILSHAGEATENMAVLHGLMAMPHIVGAALNEVLNIPNNVKPQVENVVASMPREEVKNFYQEQEQKGTVPEGTTNKVIEHLNNFDEQKKVVADLPIDEEQKAVVASRLTNKGEPEQISQPIELNPEVTNEQKNTTTAEPINAAPEEKPQEEPQAEVIQPKGVEGNQPSNEPQPSEEIGVAETKPIEPTQEPTENKVEPSKFPKPQIPLSEMNSEQLDNYANTVKDYSKNQEVEFFGKEGAKEYREAQSISNSSFASHDKRQAAYKVIDKYEKQLTPQQHDEFFGINAPEGLVYDHAELRDIATRVRVVEESENVDELASSAKNALAQMNEKNPSIESKSILNAVRKKADELNIKPEQLIKEVLKKVGNQYKDGSDAEFMMQTTLQKLLTKEEPAKMLPDAKTTAGKKQEDVGENIQGDNKVEDVLPNLSHDELDKRISDAQNRQRDAADKLNDKSVKRPYEETKKLDEQFDKAAADQSALSYAKRWKEGKKPDWSEPVDKDYISKESKISTEKANADVNKLKQKYDDAVAELKKSKDVENKDGNYTSKNENGQQLIKAAHDAAFNLKSDMLGITASKVDHMKIVKTIHKGHITSIKNAIEEGDYDWAIKNNLMSPNEAKSIIESAGLEVPKEILEKSNQEQGVQESDTTKMPQGTESQAPKKEQQKPEKQKDNSVVDDVKPIRQLGNGANVYYETKRYRVNDASNGKVLLNIEGEDGGMAIANIEFDNAKEAVQVADKLNQIYPKGVPDAVLIDKVVEDIRKGKYDATGSDNKVSKALNVNNVVANKISEIATKSKDFNNFKEQVKDILTANAKKTSDKEQVAAADTNESGNKVGKGAKEEKIKTFKKRAKPTIKSPLYKKALDIEDESPRAQTLKYFINGGKIHTDALKELFGNKGGKNVNAELNAKLQLRGKDAPKTIDALAHKLWDNSPEEVQNKYDSQDFRNAIEDVLQSHNSRTSMAEEMVNTMSVDEKAMSDWYDKTYSVAEKHGIEEEDLNHAIDILEGLSDEEIQKIADEQPNAYGSHEYIKKVMELHGVEEAKNDDQITNLLSDVSSGKINADDAAIKLDESGVEVSHEVYDQFREAEKNFIKGQAGLQVGDTVTIKGKNGNKDFKGNFRGITKDGRYVVVGENGQQSVHDKSDIIEQPTVEQTKKAYNTANNNYNKALSDLNKAQEKVAKEQASQQDIFKGTQKGMFGGVSGDEAKSILEPLKTKVKEAKAALDEADKNWENAVSRSQPTLDIPDADRKKISDQIRDISKKIKGSDPNALYSDITALPRYVIGKALDLVADAIDAGETIADAIAKGAKHLMDKAKESKIKLSESKANEIVSNELFETEYFNNKLKDLYSDLTEKKSALPKEETPPAEPPKEPPVAENGKEPIGIKHEDTKVIREQHGLGEYEKIPETIKAWDEEAGKRIDNGEMPALLKKMDEGNTVISAVEQRMMGKYIATLNDEVTNNPTPDSFAKLRHAVELSDKIGGSEWGRSGRARQDVFLPEDSLGKFLIDKESAQEAKLTDKQLEEQTKEYNELKKAHDDYKAAYEKEQEESARLRAENEFLKSKKGTKKNTDRDYSTEKKQVLQDARDALKKLRESGNLQSAIPFAQQAKELITIAPHVGKYAKILIDEGIEKFEQLVDRLHDEFKEFELSKKDIINILDGQYKQKKELTRNEKAELLRNLKREASLLNQIEKERKGIEKEKSQTKKAQKTERIQDLENKLKELQKKNKEKEGITEKTDEEFNAARGKSLIKSIERVSDDLKSGKYLEEKPEPKEHKLTAKTQALQDRLIELQKKREIEIYKDQLSKRTKWQKAMDIWYQALGLKRLVQTAIDVSLIGRQLATVTFNPRRWEALPRILSSTFKSFGSQKQFDRINYAIHHSAFSKEMMDDGIHFIEFESPNVEKRSDFFPNKSFLYEVKYLREPFLASNRAADASANVARFELYMQGKRRLERMGITRENSPEEYKGMAKAINNITGSGNMLSWIENNHGAKKFLGNTLYGAKFMASRFNLLNPVYYAKLPKAVRIEALKDIISFTTTLTAISLAAKAAGAKVSADPNDSDFLKIRIGDNVYDLSGGLIGYVKIFARMTEAAYTRGKYMTGNATDKEVQSSVGRAEYSLNTFVQSKLAPNTGYAVSAFTGKNAIGKDFNPTDVLKIYPMYVDDLIQAYNDSGITSLATVLVPDVFGIGVSTYPEKTPTLFSETAQKDPTFKFFMDKSGGHMPNVELKNQTYIDATTKHTHSIGEAPKEKQDQYTKVHEAELLNGLKAIKSRNYVYTNGVTDVKGNKQISITYKNGKNLKRIPLGKLNEAEYQKIESLVQKSASIKAKQKVFKDYSDKDDEENKN
jgi:hypothetical protein